MIINSAQRYERFSLRKYGQPAEINPNAPTTISWECTPSLLRRSKLPSIRGAGGVLSTRYAA